jgi:N-acetylmuramoyl-L-alanine amidase-like protein
MPFDTGIATRLRKAGLVVREVQGWKTRGVETFNPKGSVNHHTAGPPRSAGKIAPSLGIVINGRSDLSGPLCNVYMDFNGVVYVVAAGRANHAGIPDGGVCRGMHGNTDAYGLEIEHPGKSPLEPKRVIIAAKVHAALLHGKATADQVVQHWEWAPSRKIDLASNMHPGTNPTHNEFRVMVAVEMKRLTGPQKYIASYINYKGNRVEITTRNPARWASNHPAVFRRGRVVFRQA